MDNAQLLKSLYDAESNPYMPSGQAWVGPDAILNNLFVRIGAEWDGFTIHTAPLQRAMGAR